jgi:hypothetical protein
LRKFFDFHKFASNQNNVLIANIKRKKGVLKNINSRTITMLLILFSISLPGSFHQTTAYKSVVQEGSSQGIITCPSGEKYEADIAFEALSELYSGPYAVEHSEWTIRSPNGFIPNHENTSGVITTLTIIPSGYFNLTGEETQDNICDSQVDVSSIYIEITGQCKTGTGATTVYFTASNGQRAFFPSSPICTISR